MLLPASMLPNTLCEIKWNSFSEQPFVQIYGYSIQLKNHSHNKQLVLDCDQDFLTLVHIIQTYSFECMDMQLFAAAIVVLCTNKQALLERSFEQHPHCYHHFVESSKHRFLIVVFLLCQQISWFVFFKKMQLAFDHCCRHSKHKLICADNNN